MSGSSQTFAEELVRLLGPFKMQSADGSRYSDGLADPSSILRAQIDTGAHPASYSIEAMGSFPGEKAAGP
jgi:hypothetical protein